MYGPGRCGDGLDARQRIKRCQGTRIRGTGRRVASTRRHQDRRIRECFSQRLQPLGERDERGVGGLGPIEYVARHEHHRGSDLDDLLDRLVERTSDIGLSNISALLDISKRPITEVQIRQVSDDHGVSGPAALSASEGSDSVTSTAPTLSSMGFRTHP